MTGFLLQHAFLFALSFRRYSITKFWKNVALCFDASECGHVISLARESTSTAGKSFPLDPVALSDATSERSLSTSAAYPNRYLGHMGGLFEHTPGPFTLRKPRRLKVSPYNAPDSGNRKVLSFPRGRPKISPEDLFILVLTLFMHSCCSRS